jgi:hypothetical protein
MTTDGFSGSSPRRLSPGARNPWLSIEVERVVLNALPLPPHICAFGDWFVIVFGEADPPSSRS